MESRRPQQAYPAISPLSKPLSLPSASSEASQYTSVDAEMLDPDCERTQRAASVLSGMSIEDMEAAQTLNILQTRYRSPSQSQTLPNHIKTTSSFDQGQQEPLLSLLTSQHPLAASLVNGSLSVYKTTQSYIPGAEWTERNVGLPIAGTISRVTGVEGGIRWALQGRRDSTAAAQGSAIAVQTPDVEKGFAERAPGHHRTASGVSYAESLPAYTDGDRSPPYSEQQIALQSQQRPSVPGWRQQLAITTSGLGVAMSDESIRSLKYCLSWLRWANERLGGAVQSLKDLLIRWDERNRPQQNAMSVSAMTSDGNDDAAQAALTARIAALKADVLQTLKQVVDVVSNYAGGALPDNAKKLVHRHLTSLPQRFSIASAMTSSNNENERSAVASAQRVMVLAQEGLDMMTQVSQVVNDTLVSAESWCEKLGMRKSQQEILLASVEEKTNEQDDRDRSVTIGREESMDVKMEM